MAKYITFTSKKALTDKERETVISKIKKGVIPRGVSGVKIYTSTDDNISLERLQNEFKTI